MPVIVNQIANSGGHAEAAIDSPRGRYRVAFDSMVDFSGQPADAFLALALPAAMRCRQLLVIEGEVSRRLLDSAPAIQSLYHRWDRDLAIVPVKAGVSDDCASATGPPALCFTGGVDSMHAAVNSPGASLLYVHGLDVPLNNHALRKTVGQRLAQAAMELGRPFIEMETNLRVFSDSFMDWHVAFGGALGACGLLLAGQISSLDISAGAVARPTLPDGAHPLLNPLFSTERLQVQCVGHDMERLDKIRALARHPVAQKCLRVCWENWGNAYNCGVCEKCLRTMASLQIFGALSEFRVFETGLDLGRLSRAVGISEETDFFLEHVLEVAHENHADPALIRSLERAVIPGRAKRIRLLRKLLPRTIRDWQYRIGRIIRHPNGNNA